MNKPLIISNYQGLNQRYLYSERDLNPHNRYGHKILSLACLPFHHPSIPGAEDGTRTRDPDLGKVVLYQLSYFRNIMQFKELSGIIIPMTLPVLNSIVCVFLRLQM